MEGVFDFPFPEEKKAKKRKLTAEEKEQLKDAVKLGLKLGIEKSVAEYKRFFAFAKKHDGACPPKIAAKFLGISVQRIHELITEGRLETETFFEGKRVLITGESIIKYIDERKAPHRPKKNN